MAWEWVSPVSAAGGALLGSVVTFWTSNSLARKNALADDKRAQNEREQQRAAEAYVALLELTTKLTEWAAFSLSILRTGAEPQRPTPPDRVETVRAVALLNAYGSTSARRLYERFWSCVQAVEAMERRIATEQEARREGVPSSDFTPSGGRRALEEELRPAVIAAHNDLQLAVNAELREARD